MSEHDHEKNMHGSEETRSEETQIDQELHERLCAYVFGELQGAERAALEAELLRSPALQRERERLTATIGLVKMAVPDEGLSLAVRRDLVASARRSRFRFLRGRTLVRVAAAAVLILGSAFAVRMLTGRYPVTEDVKVARGLRNERAAGQEGAMAAQVHAGAEAPDALQRLGYAGEDGPSAAPSAAAPLTPEVSEQLDSLGYGGDDGRGVTLGDENSPEPELLAIDPNSRPVPLVSYDSSISLAKTERGKSGETTGGTSIGVGGGGHYGTGTPSAFASRISGGGSSGGQAGRAGMKTMPAFAPAQELLAPPSDGLHRGPGDSVSARETLRKKVDGLVAEPTVSLAEPLVVDGVIVAREHEELETLGYGGADESQEDKDERRPDPVTKRAQREPVQTRQQVAAQVEQLLGATRVAPGETASDMFFRYWGDSPFQPAAEQPSSTFAVDVDTASYALARAYLSGGKLPPREAVRTEEFVNYFKADQPAPTDGKPFAIGLELAPSLFAQDARTEMLRVTLRGKDVQDFERQPVNLTFVIDNSGSMEQGGRLELVKRSLALLLRQLYNSDSVAVVKFSNDAKVVTQRLLAARRGELESLIQAIVTEGGTNVEAGLRKGYELALQDLARNAVNRVILCSDGVGNIGETSAKGLLELVKDSRAKGVYLNTVGVGMGNMNDAFLEELADKGDGVCNYVDSDAEAKRVFVDNLASAIQPIARDVKIQVEFDPAQVESWRLLGYENRALRAQDFRNDKIDAGEVNAGHQVTALYELVRRPSQSGPLATVRLRYKPPFAIDQGKEGERARAEAEQGLEQERTLQASAVLPGFAAATNGYQRAVLVAQFAEVLRQSVHARGDDFAVLLREARRLEKALGDPDFTEFVALLGKANPLLDARSKQETPRVQQALDELSRLRYELELRGRKRELAAAAGEPERATSDKEAEERADREAREAIQRLEAEVSTELCRASGIEPLTPEELQKLSGLGYVKVK